MSLKEMFGRFMGGGEHNPKKPELNMGSPSPEERLASAFSQGQKNYSEEERRAAARAWAGTGESAPAPEASRTVEPAKDSLPSDPFAAETIPAKEGQWSKTGGTSETIEKPEEGDSLAA